MEALQEKYNKEVVPSLLKKFEFKSVMQVPHLEKVVLSMGLGAAIQDAKVLENAVEQLGLIAGQKAKITTARTSIATFKLREGMKIGACVTLRRRNMYAFVTRLVNAALPSVRDFKGLSKKGMDGRGNYSLGIKEQIIFPEIDYDKVDKIRGLNITLVTTAETDEEGLELLKALGFPFRN